MGAIREVTGCGMYKFADVDPCMIEINLDSGSFHCPTLAYLIRILSTRCQHQQEPDDVGSPTIATKTIGTK